MNDIRNKIGENVYKIPAVFIQFAEYYLFV